MKYIEAVKFFVENSHIIQLEYHCLYVKKNKKKYMVVYSGRDSPK